MTPRRTNVRPLWQPAFDVTIRGVPRYRRPRRQGVVYGPAVSHREQSQDGGFLGRLLGMLLVLGAVAVLAAAALSFVDDEGLSPAVSPSPTAAALESPRPTSEGDASPGPGHDATAQPTAQPTAEPEPEPQPEPSPQPSPDATPFAVSVQEGRGFVTFGTGRGPELTVANPRATFELGDRPFYSARLTQTTPTRELAIEIRKVNPQDGSEALVAEDRLGTSLPRVHTVRRRFRTDELDGPGIYVLRFMRGERVMAEGYFEVTG